MDIESRPGEIVVAPINLADYRRTKQQIMELSSQATFMSNLDELKSAQTEVDSSESENAPTKPWSYFVDELGYEYKRII